MRHRPAPPRHHDEPGTGRPELHNAYAGQGAVLLDIGGDVGALVLQMPASLAGTEIEICPAGEPHPAARRSHVAVIARPVRGTVAHTAVFPELRHGRYELYRKSDGPTEVVVEVRGGQVAEAVWPSG
jgi:hypothetical protein